METTKHYEACNVYLDARKGTYEFRCKRYKLVADKIEENGLSDYPTIVDVGAGRCEFGRYFRERFKSDYSTYIPLDGSIDGINLEKWCPNIVADYYVFIEFIEHLTYPWRLLYEAYERSKFGVILTTPNADCVDVLGMDETHKTPITNLDLKYHEIESKSTKLFTEDREDTLLGWRLK